METKDTRFQTGDMIMSWQMPWCTYSMVDCTMAMKVRNNLTPEEALGVCGMPAMTAYFGMEAADPKVRRTPNF
jgi:NADPH-dependent curcumin reductase CurA